MNQPSQESLKAILEQAGTLTSRHYRPAAVMHYLSEQHKVVALDIRIPGWILALPACLVGAVGIAVWILATPLNQRMSGVLESSQGGSSCLRVSKPVSEAILRHSSTMTITTVYNETFEVSGITKGDVGNSSKAAPRPASDVCLSVRLSNLTHQFKGRQPVVVIIRSGLLYSEL